LRLAKLNVNEGPAFEAEVGVGPPGLLLLGFVLGPGSLNWNEGFCASDAVVVVVDEVPLVTGVSVNADLVVSAGLFTVAPNTLGAPAPALPKMLGG